MSLPNYEGFMHPLLVVLRDKGILHVHRLNEYMIDYFKLSHDELSLTLQNGFTPLYQNRIGWALTYLGKAGLVRRTARATYEITEEGLKALESNSSIDSKFLYKYESFVAFQHKQNAKPDNSQPTAKQSISVQQLPTSTPQESLEETFQIYKKTIMDKLLTAILDNSAEFFEHLVLTILNKLGYGDKKWTIHTGRSGDGGIDGVIKQDILGLDKIYIQAKRYSPDNGIDRPTLQQFVGSIGRDQKGIFITTSYFKDTARKYADESITRIILIDGDMLTSLMYDYGIGVSTKSELKINDLDTDFFQS